MIRGQIEPHPVSRFVREISRDQLDQGKKAPTKTSIGNLKGGFGRDMRDAIHAKPFAPKPSVSGSFESRPLESGTYESESSAPKTYTKFHTAAKADGPAVSPGGAPDYGVGDSVRHRKFGVGTVLAIKEGKRDFEVTVDFPAWGVKKMFAEFAKLEKIVD